jgi:hypothetical protein
MFFPGWLRRFWQWARQPERSASSPPFAAPVSAPPATAPKPESPSEIFTPTRPRSGRRALVGREAELDRILDSLLDEHAHVVLYSERGRGKTSLGNLAVSTLRRRGAIVARYACDANSDFGSIIRGLMRSLPPSLLAAYDAPAAQDPRAELEGCEAALPNRALKPADVAGLMDRLTCPFLVCLVDEFDRVTDQQTRTRLADTIKHLSDRAIRLHFVIVGVSATLEQIIGQHPSIQRNIAAIHLPLLHDHEIVEMLEKGGQQAGVEFSADAKEIVVFVARGMPYMAQLLGLRIAQSALRRGGGPVLRSDLVAAVQRLIDEAGSGVLAIFNALAGSTTVDNMPGVLRRVARARQDAWGRMEVGRAGRDVIVGGCRIPESAWSLLLAAGVFVQPDGEAGAAHIQDRPLLYHVQLLAARDRLAALESEDGPREKARPTQDQSQNNLPNEMPRQRRAGAPQAVPRSVSGVVPHG